MLVSIEIPPSGYLAISPHEDDIGRHRTGEGSVLEKTLLDDHLLNPGEDQNQ